MAVSAQQEMPLLTQGEGYKRECRQLWVPRNHSHLLQSQLSGGRVVWRLPSLVRSYRLRFFCGGGGHFAEIIYSSRSFFVHCPRVPNAVYGRRLASPPVARKLRKQKRRNYG